MKLTEKQKIKLAWLVHQGQAKGFTANAERFGFDDISYVVVIDDLDFAFDFRLFPKKNEFEYVRFTPMEFCPYIPQASEQLQQALEHLLDEERHENS